MEPLTRWGQGKLPQLPPLHAYSTKSMYSKPITLLDLYLSVPLLLHSNKDIDFRDYSMVCCTLGTCMVAGEIPILISGLNPPLPVNRNSNGLPFTSVPRNYFPIFNNQCIAITIHFFSTLPLEILITKPCSSFPMSTSPLIFFA